MTCKAILTSKVHVAALPSDARDPNYSGVLHNAITVLAFLPQNTASTAVQQIAAENMTIDAEQLVNRHDSKRSHLSTKIYIGGSCESIPNLETLLAHLIIRNNLILDEKFSDRGSWSECTRIYYDIAKLITSQTFTQWMDANIAQAPWIIDTILNFIHTMESKFQSLGRDPLIRLAADEEKELELQQFKKPQTVLDSFIRDVQTCIDDCSLGNRFSTAPIFSKHHPANLSRKPPQTPRTPRLQPTPQQQQQQQYQHFQPPGEQHIPGMLYCAGGSREIELPRGMSRTLCKLYLLQNARCNRTNCSFAHVVKLAELPTVNDQRLLYDRTPSVFSSGKADYAVICLTARI